MHLQQALSGLPVISMGSRENITPIITYLCWGLSGDEELVPLSVSVEVTAPAGVSVTLGINAAVWD